MSSTAAAACIVFVTSATEGGGRLCFHPCLSVCLSVCEQDISSYGQICMKLVGKVGCVTRTN